MKIIAFFTIFTALTATYVYWGTLLETSVANITIIFFIIMLISMLYYSKNKNFIVELPTYWFRPLLAMVIIGPIFVIIVTRSVDFRSFFLQLFFLLLYIFTYQTYKIYGREWMYKVFLYSLIFTIISGLISVFYQKPFIEYSAIIGGWGFYGGRAVGFYLQPNTYAFAVNMLFIGIIILSNKVKSILYLYPFVFIGIIMSGSRSNLAGFGIITVFLILYLFKYKKKELIKSLQYIIILIFILISLFPKIYHTLEMNDKYAGLKLRIDFIVNVITQSENIDSTLQTLESAGSMQDRLRYQKVYDKMIVQSPIIGYGFGVQRKLRESGKLDGSAHNVIYEILIQGGILYFSFFIYFIYRYTKNYFRYKKYKDFKYNLGVKTIIFFMFFYFFFTTTFFKERITFVLFAVLAAYSIELSINKRRIS